MMRSHWYGISPMWQSKIDTVTKRMLSTVGLKLLYAYISTGCILNAATGIGDSDTITGTFQRLRNYNDTELLDDGMCMEYADLDVDGYTLKCPTTIDISP